MSNRENLTIKAIIPHESDPNLQVVDQEGQYPSREYIPGSGTHESTFRANGRDVIGRALSVDERRVDLGNDQTIVYQAKPVRNRVNPGSGYQWARKPE